MSCFVFSGSAPAAKTSWLNLSNASLICGASSLRRAAIRAVAGWYTGSVIVPTPSCFPYSGTQSQVSMPSARPTPAGDAAYRGRIVPITKPAGMLTSTSATSARYRCSGQPGWRTAPRTADDHDQDGGQQDATCVGQPADAEQGAGQDGPVPGVPAGQFGRDSAPAGRPGREQPLAGAEGHLGEADNEH